MRDRALKRREEEEGIQLWGLRKPRRFAFVGR